MIDRNQAAIRLYDKLGFKVVRDLMVWSLAATGDRPPVSQPVDLEYAHMWIVAHRESREPWQRTDETLAEIHARGARLGALVVERRGEVTGAVVFRENAGAVSAFQVAALDDGSAADALLAAAAGRRDLRLANTPVGERPWRALQRLGARAVARQYEMLLRT